jgi:hypothetical protein
MTKQQKYALIFSGVTISTLAAYGWLVEDCMSGNATNICYQDKKDYTTISFITVALFISLGVMWTIFLDKIANETLKPTESVASLSDVVLTETDGRSRSSSRDSIFSSNCDDEGKHESSMSLI